MNNIMDKWMGFIEELALEWPKDKIGKAYIKTGKKQLTISGKLTEEIFLICKYQNPVLKMTQLEDQYLDRKSFDDLYEALEDFVAMEDATVSLIGNAKKGTSSNRKHCLKDIEFHFYQNRADLNFRCSDIIKKFLTDIFFVQQKVMKPLGCINYSITCNFDTVMLRSPFWFIYLDVYGNCYGEEKLRERIERYDPITLSWLNYYSKHLDRDINYKSLERGRDRMEESTWWPVYREYITRYKSK